jgi:hypothetical protein
MVFSIEASISADKEALTEKINSAYLAKYKTPQNIKYAIGIIEEKHMEKTMEFTITE